MNAEALRGLAKDEGFFLAAVSANRYGLENCSSLLVVGLVYGNDFADEDNRPSVPAKIAPFARRNYYRLAVQKLQRIAKKLKAEQGGEKSNYRIYCNSSAVNEKKIAFESGLADMGRNTLLLTREYGSLFVTGMLTLPFAVEGRVDAARPFALCAGCARNNPPCQKACPTSAVSGENRIEKERCIQWYLSGHGDAVPENVKNHWNGRLYGCTSCQDACPHHQKKIRGVDCAIGVLPAVMDARQIADASAEEIKKMFHGTALGLSWLCPDGIRRNAELCLK
jgi:epoxyqueuosine reductase